MAYLIISQYNIWICPKSVLGPKPFGHQHFERSNPGDGDWAASQPHHKKGHIDQTMHVVSCFRKHFLKSQGQYQRRTQFQKKVWSRFWQRKRTCHPPGLWRHGVPAFTLTNTGFYQAGLNFWACRKWTQVGTLISMNLWISFFVGWHDSDTGMQILDKILFPCVALTLSRALKSNGTSHMPLRA